MKLKSPVFHILIFMSYEREISRKNSILQSRVLLKQLHTNILLSYTWVFSYIFFKSQVFLCFLYMYKSDFLSSKILVIFSLNKHLFKSWKKIVILKVIVGFMEYISIAMQSISYLTQPWSNTYQMLVWWFLPVVISFWMDKSRCNYALVRGVIAWLEDAHRHSADDC